MSVEILFPVGRLVGGSLYREQPAKKNKDGSVRVDANGKPISGGFAFGVAYAKNGTTHWAQTEWGQKIWAEGHAAWPGGQGNAPTFAWKVTDGDSLVPNKRGNKPAEQEGYPGHWVVWFGGQFAPQTCDASGAIKYTDGVERIKPGHFVQVFGSVASNKSTESPGVYMNYKAVAHSGFGPEIDIGSSVDTSKVGFGAAALPPGASAVPLAAMPAAQAAHIAGPAAAPPVAPAPPAVPGMQPPPTAIVPDPRIMQPAVPLVPAAPPAAAVAHQMTAKANGATYEQFKGNGWTDDQLRQQGYML